MGATKEPLGDKVEYRINLFNLATIFSFFKYFWKYLSKDSSLKSMIGVFFKLISIGLSTDWLRVGIDK